MTRLLRLLITTSIVLVALHTGTVWRVWQLRLTKQCPRCNLMGVTLNGLDLRQANLRHADLRWAKLEKVRLDGADLRSANLRHAHLEDVTIHNTDFCGAIMMNAVKGYCITHDPTYLSQRSQTR